MRINALIIAIRRSILFQFATVSFCHFYAYKSHRIICNDDCALQPKEFKEGLEAFRIWAEKANVTSYDENTGKGLLRHIYFRKGFATGEIMACAVINGTLIPESDLLVSL